MISPRLLLPVAMLIVAAPAFAGEPKVDSKITYRNSVQPPNFVHEGEVRSDLRKCEKGRTVRLYGEGFEKPFASDTTNDDGQWRITQGQDGIPSDYYARVRKETKGGVICKADESPHKPLN